MIDLIHGDAYHPVKPCMYSGYIAAVKLRAFHCTGINDRIQFLTIDPRISYRKCNRYLKARISGVVVEILITAWYVPADKPVASAIICIDWLFCAAITPESGAALNQLILEPCKEALQWRLRLPAAALFITLTMLPEF